MTASWKKMIAYVILVLGSFFLCFGVVDVITDSESEAIDNRVGSSNEDHEGFCAAKDGQECLGQRIKLVHLEGHKIGHKEELSLVLDKTHFLETINMRPVIFEIKDFFNPDECDEIIKLATKQGLKTSVTHAQGSRESNIKLLDLNHDRKLSYQEMRQTIEDAFDIYLIEDDIKEMYKVLNMDRDGNGFITPDEMQHTSKSQLHDYLTDVTAKDPVKRSRLSSQTWIYPDNVESAVVKSFQERITKVTGLPQILINKHSYFQVVQYGQDGHYNAHTDSGDDFRVPCCHLVTKQACIICRYMTIMVYLNDVEEGGETAFLLANNETIDEAKFRSSGDMNLSEYCDKANLRLKPKKGTAVIWYNHRVDEETGWLGKLDPYTWHGGCPVRKGEKWIMNRWISVSPDREVDLAED